MSAYFLALQITTSRTCHRSSSPSRCSVARSTARWLVQVRPPDRSCWVMLAPSILCTHCMLRPCRRMAVLLCRHGAWSDAQGRQAGQEEEEDRPCQAPHSVQPPLRQRCCRRRQEEGAQLQQRRINCRRCAPHRLSCHEWKVSSRPVSISFPGPFLPFRF